MPEPVSDKKLQWLQQFTGINPVDGAVASAGGLADQGADLERRTALRAQLASQVLGELRAKAADFQQALAVRDQNGRQLLDVKGGQLKEIDFSELGVTIKLADLPQAAGDKLAAYSMALTRAGTRLQEATWMVQDAPQPLFDDDAMRNEFWLPLVRERILPEGLTGTKFSETQKMLDATNQLYQDANQAKAQAGELTPGGQARWRMATSGASDLLALGGSLIGPFAGDAAGLQLAQTALNTAAQVLDKGSELVDQALAKKFADSASGGLELLSSVTSGVLQSIGIDKAIVDAVESGFAAGPLAIKAGQSFAEGESGVEAGLGFLGQAFAQAFGSAAGVTSGPVKEAMQGLGTALPAAFQLAVNGKTLRQQILDQDFEGIIETLGSSAKTTLNAVQSELKMVAQASNPAKAKSVGEGIDKQTDTISGFIDLAQAGAQTGFKTAMALYKGKFEDAIFGLIDDVGSHLSDVLKSAGLPKDSAEGIARIYGSAASAPKALKALMQDPPKVDEAMAVLADGIKEAFASAAPDNKALQTAGGALAQTVQGLVDGKAIVDLFREGKYEEAITTLVTKVESQLGGAMKLAGMESDDGEGKDGESKDGGGKDGGGDQESQARVGQLKQLLEQARAAVKSVSPELLQEGLAKAEQAVDAKQAKEKEAADRAESEAVIRAAQAEVAQMSEAQRAGVEASSIEKMIAQVQRDQMIFKLATQITQGGAAFLANWVPALGAVSVAVKLASHLYAAGQRAKQVYAWMQSRDDLANAQSALTSSAQNFVNNQGEQLLHYSIQATAAAADLAGQIAKMSGVAALPAQILATTAQGIAKTEEIVRNKAKAYNLEEGWKVTVESLRNPGNRRKGLEARLKNPTLAKYSIAWGAVILKDPLARNAMRACDLDEATLSNESANVDKVVQYLETFYEDDDKLYRDLDPAPDWADFDLELSRGCLVNYRRRAKDKLKGVTLDLSAYEGQLALYLGAVEQGGAAERRLAEARKQLDAARAEASRKPRAKGEDAPKPDPRAVTEVLAAIATQRNSLEARRRSLAGMEAALALPGARSNGTAPKVEAAELEAVRQVNLRLGRRATGERKAVERQLADLATESKALQAP